jgi:hypothetical protein
MPDMRKEIYGVEPEDVVKHMGKVMNREHASKLWLRALEGFDIPPDVAVVFTEEERHPVDSAEAAYGEVENEKVFAIFLHRISRRYFERIYERLVHLYPQIWKDEEKGEYLTLYLQKVLWHEMRHIQEWRDAGRYIVPDENAAEEYAVQKLGLWGEKLIKFLFFHDSVLLDFFMEGLRKENKKLKFKRAHR